MFERAARWLRAEAPFVLVVALILAAVVYLTVAPGHWRRGSAVIALALAIAAVLRATLDPPRAGMLVVRGRWRDVLAYAALCAVIVAVDVRLH